MMRQSGQVMAVNAEVQGGVVTSWAGTRMEVLNAADFDRAGGRLIVPGGAVYDYVDVAEGEQEGEADVVTTLQSAPSGWPAEETRVDLYPQALDVWAEVELDAEGSLLAVVPHALRPMLAVGLRDEADREGVVVELRGQQWVVADVVGRAAVVDGDAVDVGSQPLSSVLDNLAMALGVNSAAMDDLDASLSSLNAALADGSALPDGVIVQRHIAADAVTANAIKAGSVTTAKVAANAITANELAANAVTANAIKAGSIDGMTITGAVLRTAASGKRAQMDTSGIRAWDTDGTQTVNLNGSDNLVAGVFRTSTSGAAAILTPVGDGTGKSAGLWLSTDGSTSGAQGAIYMSPADGLVVRGAQITSSMRLGRLLGDWSVSSGLTCEGALTANTGMTIGGTGPWRAMSTNAAGQLTVDGSMRADAFILSGSTTASLAMSGSTAVLNAEFRASGTKTVTASANGYIDANGTFAKTGSARRLKDHIRYVESDGIDPARILDVRPRTWWDKSQLRDNGDSPEGLRRVPGVVAEEVRDAGLDEYVTYSEDGRVEGVMYDRLWTLLIPVVKRQAETIAELTARVEALEAR